MKADNSVGPAMISKWAPYLMALVFFAIGPIAIFAAKGLAPLLVFGGIVALLDLTARNGVRDIFAPSWLIGIVAAALILALVSSTFSPEPPSKFGLLARLTGLCIFGLAVLAWVAGRDLNESPRLGLPLFAGTCLAVTVSIFFQIFLEINGASLWGGHAHDSLAAIKPGASILSILIWPAIAFLGQRGSIWQLVALVVLALAAVAPAHSALISTLLGSVAYFLFRWRKRFARLVAGLLCVTLIMSLPVLFERIISPANVIQAIPSLPESAKHRLYIWQYTSQRIAEKPITGWGFDASRSIPGAREPAAVGNSLLPLHPHNFVLQLWLELGLAGVLLASLFFSALFVLPRESRVSPAIDAAHYAMIVTLFGNAFLSFGIWQNWWFSALWLLPAAFYGSGNKLPPARN